MGRSEEEKRAEAQQREAEAQRKAAEAQQKEAANAEAAYRNSPLGLAEAARQRGDQFFQVTIAVSSIEGNSSLTAGPNGVSKTTHATGAGDILGRIEAIGWHLEHASWVFIETGMSSRDHVLATGQMTTTTGRVDGIYLFRRVPG